MGEVILFPFLNELQYYSQEDEPHVQGFREIIVNEEEPCS